MDNPSLILQTLDKHLDPQDMADAEFMIHHDHIAETQLLQAIERMKPVDLIELRDAFEKAKPMVLKFATESSTTDRV